MIEQPHQGAPAELATRFPSLAHATGEETHVDLRQIVGEVEFLLGRMLPKSISVRTELAANLRPIVADAKQVLQMLLNLCINARDAMPDGGVLTIDAANPPFEEASAPTLGGSSGRFVRLTVSDTGTGVAADVRSRIFDPFFTTKQPHAGRGMGLSTVLAIIRRHQGMIHVQSPPGGGARFEVYLPMFDPNQRPRYDSMKPALLIADAHRELLHSFKVLCSARGFDAATCADGVECLECLTVAIPDVLVVDLDIPWGGGDGVLACLREDCADSIHPVVVVTGWDSPQVLSQRSGIPSRNCFSKPFLPSRLLDSACESLQGEFRDLGNGSGSLDTKDAS